MRKSLKSDNPQEKIHYQLVELNKSISNLCKTLGYVTKILGSIDLDNSMRHKEITYSEAYVNDLVGEIGRQKLSKIVFITITIVMFILLVVIK